MAWPALLLALVATPLMSAEVLKSRYGAAYRIYQTGDYSAALTAFEQIRMEAAGHPLEPNILYWIGESHYGLGDYVRAATQFCSVATRHAGSSKARDAGTKLALMVKRGQLGSSDCNQQQPAASARQRGQEKSVVNGSQDDIEDANHCLTMGEGLLQTECSESGLCMKMWRLLNRCQYPLDISYCYPLIKGSQGSEIHWRCESHPMAASGGKTMNSVTTARFYAISCRAGQARCSRFAHQWVERMVSHYPAGEDSTTTHPRVEWPREMAGEAAERR